MTHPLSSNGRDPIIVRESPGRVAMINRDARRLAARAEARRTERSTPMSAAKRDTKKYKEQRDLTEEEAPAAKRYCRFAGADEPTPHRFLAFEGDLDEPRCVYCDETPRMVLNRG